LSSAHLSRKDYQYHETNESCAYPQIIPKQRYEQGHHPNVRKRILLVYPNNQNNFGIFLLSKNSDCQFQSWTRNGMLSTRSQRDYDQVVVSSQSAILGRCWDALHPDAMTDILAL
jgi:hypothetical protein